jgi:membrane fusion protein, copper/silver efflux system
MWKGNSTLFQPKKKNMKHKILIISFTLLTGVFIGWLLFHSSTERIEKQDSGTEQVQGTVWTCSMHPQIRMVETGKCPICAMDLIPLVQNSAAALDPDAIRLSRDAAQLANVLTTKVSKQNPVKEIRLYGKVQADEGRLQSQVAHVSGRMEELTVNFTGESVTKGQLLARIYSPELVTAQQELLESAKIKQTQPGIYEAAKEKLLRWKLTEKQVEAMEETGHIMNTVDVISNTHGIVLSKRLNTGDYVSQGSVIFDIADLSRVWVMFDAYESDLRFLKKGEKIDFTLQALPGEHFSGNIVFVDPVMDPTTRVAKVRIETENQSGRLKPEMFASGLVSCSMDEFRNNIIIPRSAVLWTGKRSIVYVRQPGDEPVFKLREVELGPDLGGSYVIISGLSEGEEIVTSGTFSVDATAQLEGKPSMMNPPGRETSALPGMGMPGKTEPPGVASPPSLQSPLQHITFKVYGLCEMCKDRIEKAALSVTGVKTASWDMDSKILKVEYTENVKPLTFHKAVARVGHDTDLVKADDAVYNALPECCLYRNQ